MCSTTMARKLASTLTTSSGQRRTYVKREVVQEELGTEASERERARKLLEESRAQREAEEAARQEAAEKARLKKEEEVRQAALEMARKEEEVLLRHMEVNDILFVNANQAIAIS